MATGIQAFANRRMRVLRLVEGITAVNGAPSDASLTAGVAMPSDLVSHWMASREATLLIKSTAGGGTMTLAYVRLWGCVIYTPADDKATGGATSTATWYPLGPGTDTDKGKINNIGALGETGTDLVRHAEPVFYPGHFDRLYVEFGTFGGTGTPTYTADLLVPVNEQKY